MRSQTSTKFLLSISCVIVAAALSVSSAAAQSVMQMAQGDVPYLGVGGQDITAESAKTLRLKEVRGVEITMVYPDTAAAKADLEKGDVVLDYNGQKLEGWEQFRRTVSETPVGRDVRIGISRNGSLQTLTVTMGSRKQSSIDVNGHQIPLPSMPTIEPPAFSMPEFRTFARNPALGIYAEPLGKEAQLAEFFGVKDGLLIRSVTKDSAADKAGLKAGDVITRIDDSAVSTPGDITSKFHGGPGKNTYTVTVVRNHKEMPVTVTIESRGTMKGSLAEPRIWLQFSPDGGVIQGAKEGVTKITWQ